MFVIALTNYALGKMLLIVLSSCSVIPITDEFSLASCRASDQRSD